jgi:NADPH:quinone reductase-like Zn-dependent oxidoreductase
LKIGIQASGTVVETGSEVKTLRPGDEVVGLAMRRPMDFSSPPGSCSQYTRFPEDLLIPKPPHVSFETATAVFGPTVTGVQSFERGIELLKANGVADGLEGKTVFVTAALSAWGSIGIQLLKNVYGVAKVITTVSTAKVPLVEKYLPGLVDQIIDYTKTHPAKVIEPGSVDFIYNTQWDFTGLFPMLNKKKGVIISIASVPSPSLVRAILPPLPFWVYLLLGLAQQWYEFKLRGTQVKYDFISGNAGMREDVERVGEIIAREQVKAIPWIVPLEDIDAVRKAATQVHEGKGGTGQLVIKIT